MTITEDHHGNATSLASYHRYGDNEYWLVKGRVSATIPRHEHAYLYMLTGIIYSILHTFSININTLSVMSNINCIPSLSRELHVQFALTFPWLLTSHTFLCLIYRSILYTHVCNSIGIPLITFWMICFKYESLHRCPGV